MFNIEWEDYDPDEVDQNDYCIKTFSNTLLKTIIEAMSSTSMILLNASIASLFSKLSKFKKLHTTIEEQSTGFSQIFFMEFFNMGLIMLVLSFDPSGTSQTMAG